MICFHSGRELWIVEEYVTGACLEEIANIDVEAVCKLSLKAASSPKVPENVGRMYVILDFDSVISDMCCLMHKATRSPCIC